MSPGLQNSSRLKITSLGTSSVFKHLHRSLRPSLDCIRHPPDSFQTVLLIMMINTSCSSPVSYFFTVLLSQLPWTSPLLEQCLFLPVLVCRRHPQSCVTVLVPPSTAHLIIWINHRPSHPPWVFQPCVVCISSSLSMSHHFPQASKKKILEVCQHHFQIPCQDGKSCVMEGWPPYLQILLFFDFMFSLIPASPEANPIRLS